MKTLQAPKLAPAMSIQQIARQQLVWRCAAGALIGFTMLVATLFVRFAPRPATNVGYAMEIAIAACVAICVWTYAESWWSRYAPLEAKDYWWLNRVIERRPLFAKFRDDVRAMGRPFTNQDLQTLDAYDADLMTWESAERTRNETQTEYIRLYGEGRHDGV